MSVVRDVEVRHRTHDRRVDRRREPDARSREPSERVGPVEAERRRVDLDEVRLDLLEIDGHSRLVDRLGERARPRVILGEPLDVVVERVQPRSRDDAGLAHGAAEQVLLPPRAGHELARTREQRTERATEPLREAQRHRVEARGDRPTARHRAQPTR